MGCVVEHGHREDPGADSDADTIPDSVDGDTGSTPTINTAPPGDYTATNGSEMIGVPGGTFDMGSGTGDPYDQWRDHEVTLTHAFWISRTELTQDQWEAGRWRGRDDDSVIHPDCTSGDCPAGITWYDAAQYANWLSDEEGLDECYNCFYTFVRLTLQPFPLGAAWRCYSVRDPYRCTGYRLPTEAEWEYTARAGTDTTYSGGDTAVDVAWIVDNSQYSSGSWAHHEVCTTTDPENAFGLCDMSGNLREWTNEEWDGLSDYPAGSVTDPTTTCRGGSRVVRGGYARGTDWQATVAYRNSGPPNATGDGTLGMRLVRSVISP